VAATAMVAARSAESTHLRARSSLPFSRLPMMGGMRGANDGSDIHHHG
jgi:hypothetical protein